jgi:hypothetical protein
MVGGDDGCREETVGDTDSMDGGDDVPMCQAPSIDMPNSIPTTKSEEIRVVALASFQL